MTRRILADVYEGDNTTHVATLGSDRGREWLDDLEDEGSFSIESHLDHADRTHLTDGRVIRFSIDGRADWAGCEFELNPTIADPSNRKAGRVVGCTGRGLLALFDYAIVHPELGYGVLSPDTRYFGWMSRYYDHSGWGNAVELKLQSDTDDTKPWYRAPGGWTDPDAYWVGPTDGDVPPVDPGDIYLYGTYTIPSGEGGDYRIDLTADDGFEFYRDGDLAGREMRVALWGETRQIPFQADDGSHFFAAKVTNFDRPNPATNVMGFIASLRKMEGGGAIDGDVVSRAGSGTKMLAFPADEPGMTAGHIMLVNIAENQDLGWLPGLTCDFDEVYDSNGVPFPKELNVSYPVFTTLSEVMRHLRDLKAAEFAMDPVGLVLHAYVSKGTDRTASVAVTYGGNVNRLKMRHLPPGVNTVASRTSEGRSVLTERTASVTAWGTRFGGLSLGTAPSDASATEQASAFLDDHAEPVDAITDLQIEDDDWIDGTVETGDLVTGPTTSGGTASYRVHGLRRSEDAAGQPVCTPELVKTDA